MANSRSNIYPIQLQGAELNLNEYKADIKQYSGFNKNNSPYVGGCLSNLFTKDETVGTPDTTYIDKNGDIYTVNTSGLYKNDEKVLDCVGAKFFDIENMGKNAFPENVAYVYDENLYITLENNTFDIHYTHPVTKEKDIYTVNSLYYDFTNLQYFSINIKPVNISGNKIYIIGILTQIKQNSGSYVTHTVVINEKEDGQYNYYEAEEVSIWAETYGKFNLIIKIDSINANSVYYYMYSGFNNNNSYYKFDYNTYVLGIALLQTMTIKFSDFTSFAVSDTYTYCFTDDYHYVFRGDVPGLGNGGYYKHLKFDYTFGESDGTKYILITKPQTLGTHEDQEAFFSHNPALIQKWGVFSGAYFGTKVCYMIDDDVTSFGTYVENAQPAHWWEQSAWTVNNMGGILNGMVLVNNNTVSGISLPGGWILATEWNSVDENNIYFNPNTSGDYVCIWKSTNGTWYKLKESTPKLKYINGQIVINCNQVSKNSYRISDGKQLLFAPAWNNRRPNILNHNDNNYDLKDYYIATSINEYDINDNSSIIINPVVVSMLTTFLPGRQTAISEYEAKIGDFIQVNLYIDNNSYSAHSDKTIKYYSTLLYGRNHGNYEALTNIYINKDLDGLPFPTTTDGNIQYSPSLFADFISNFGNDWYIKYGSNAYQLMKNGSQSVMSFYLGTLVEDLEELFIIQGQYYGVINNCLYSIQYSNGLLQNINYICSVLNLQFCGATPYQAIFFNKTNRTLYSFTGANILQIMQPIDSISEVISYKYNPATQSIFLLTNAGVIVNGLFGMFQIAFTNPSVIYLLTEGFVIGDNAGQCKYVRYYPAEDYTRENIELETCYYGSNDTLVLVNDCLYLRLFSEEKESGEVEISATTLTNEGKTTERTTFKIKASDWDDKTDTVYLRYQPKEQRGLGISFKVNSPFKIAAMSVGTSADTILIDKVSKGAIISPQQTSSNTEW